MTLQQVKSQDHSHKLLGTAVSLRKVVLPPMRVDLCSPNQMGSITAPSELL